MDKSLIQGTPEWLEMRRRHIGASDAAAIMGTSPWTSAYQLWQEKLGLTPPKETNYAMQRGIELEPIARAAYNKLTGNMASPKVVFNDERSYMMASLDGLSMDGQTIVEIKCPGKKDHDTAAQGLVPEKYKAQLQHQLACIGLDHLHYFSYSEDSCHLVEVVRDEEYIQSLLLAEDKFWQCIQSLSAPELTDRDCPERLDEEFILIAEECKEVSIQLKFFKEKEDHLRKLLIAMANNQSCRSSDTTVRKSVRRGLVDYKSIPELQGVDLELYRKKPIETWKITHK